MKKHRFIFGAVVAFLLLLGLNCGELTAPPFWDDLMGFHRQALFLADHHFDFAALAKTGGFWEGGACVYRWPHLPSLLYGIGYALLPAAIVRLAGHLLNLALLATAAAMLARLAGARRWWWAAAALANPLLLSQSASLGQEPWLVLAFMGVVLSLWGDRWGAAWGWLIFGALVKPIMIVPAAAMTLFSLWRFLRRRDRRNVLRLIVSAALLAVLAVMLLGDSDGAVQEHVLAVAAARALEHFTRYFPLVGLALAAALLLALRPSRWRGRGGERLLLLLLLQGCFWGCYLLYSVPLPRYAGAAVMPLYLLLARGFVGWPRRTQLAAGALLLGGLVLGGGELLPPLPEHLAASGEFRERSRESVDQLAADRRLCREIEARCEGRAVVAKWPYVMMLAEPRFGYVTKPVADLLCAGILPRDLPQVRAYDPASPPADAFYIFAWNSFEFFSEFGPPLAFGPEDEVVFSERDRRGEHQEVVFVYRRKL